MIYILINIPRFIKVALICAFAATGCQTAETADIATKQMYKPVRKDLQRNLPAEAIKQLPTKEGNSFIKQTEKGWISLLSGNPTTQELVELSQDLEKRKTVYVSKEAQKFFLKETSEGYLPAEHEVIMLHIMTGLAFAKKNEPHLARVEARRAARYLEGHFGDHAGDFDDPAIRMLLGALWLYCDEWQHARVDFRMAAKLSPAYAWLGDLAEKDMQPSNFVVVMRGVGPEVVWKPDSEEAKRWGLLFVYEEEQEPQIIMGKRGKFKLDTALGSQSWYLRHLERDSKARTVLDDLRHGVDVAVGAGAAVVLTTFAVIGAVVIVAAALAATVGLAIVAKESNSLAALEGAFYISGVLFEGSLALAGVTLSSGASKSEEIYDDAADESNYYRYVRFLPSHYYGKAPKKLDPDAKLRFVNSQGDETWISPLLNLQSQKSRIQFFYAP